MNQTHQPMKLRYITPSSRTIRLTPSLPLALSNGSQIEVDSGEAGSGNFSNQRDYSSEIWGE